MNPVRTVPRALVGTSLTVLRLPADLALGVVGRDEGAGPARVWRSTDLDAAARDLVARRHVRWGHAR